LAFFGVSLGDGPGHTRLTELVLRRLGWCIQEDEFGQTMELYAPLIAGRAGGKSCLELQEFYIQVSGVLLQISPSFPWLLSTFFCIFARQEGATSPPTQLIGIGVNIAFALADVADVVPSGW
jgi:hypothetical protein